MRLLFSRFYATNHRFADFDVKLFGPFRRTAFGCSLVLRYLFTEIYLYLSRVSVQTDCEKDDFKFSFFLGRVLYDKTRNKWGHQMMGNLRGSMSRSNLLQCETWEVVQRYGWNLANVISVKNLDTCIDRSCSKVLRSKSTSCKSL